MAHVYVRLTIVLRFDNLMHEHCDGTASHAAGRREIRLQMNGLVRDPQPCGRPPFVRQRPLR